MALEFFSFYEILFAFFLLVQAALSLNFSLCNDAASSQAIASVNLVSDWKVAVKVPRKKHHCHQAPLHEKFSVPEKPKSWAEWAR